MKKNDVHLIKTFLLLLTLFCAKETFSQKIELSNDIKKKAVLYLIDKKEISGSENSWKENLDEINFRKIYSDSFQRGIYVCSSFSTHTNYYLLLKEASHVTFLNSQSLDTDMKIILIFLKKNIVSSSNIKMLKLFSEITDVYEHNQMSGSRPLIKE